jgi:hypothetical protein
MSDISQGEGWWQASDQKWYPPELHPDHQAPATPPAAPPAAAPVEAVAPPPIEPPRSVIHSPPVVPVAPAASPRSSGGTGKWIVAGVVAIAVIVLAAVLLFGRGDGKKNAVSTTPENSSTSSSPSASSSSSSSSTATSSELSQAQLQQRLLTAKDIGTTFSAGTFTVNGSSPTPCGQPNLNVQVPPTIDIGSQAIDKTSSAFFQEELSVYKDAATAAKALDLGKQGFSCTQGTTSNGQSFTFSPLRDVSSELGERAAFALDYQIGADSGELIAVLQGAHLVSFQFEAPTAADKSTLPDALAIAKQGLVKLDR